MTTIGLPIALPDAYSVRNSALPALATIANQCGFVPADGKRAPGDVLFARVGPVQYHLLIVASDGRVVHAHAGLGKVVVGNLSESWTVVGHWRLAFNCQG
jgi:cell wall-associated NlpC family hydrolase